MMSSAGMMKRCDGFVIVAEKSSPNRFCSELAGVRSRCTLISTESCFGDATFSFKCARVQPGNLGRLKIRAGGNMKSNSGHERVMKIKDVEFRS